MHDDNLQNKVLVRNNKIYLDARVNGQGYYGEGAQLNNQFVFHGLVVNYEEDKEQVLYTLVILLLFWDYGICRCK